MRFYQTAVLVAMSDLSQSHDLQEKMCLKSMQLVRYLWNRKCSTCLFIILILWYCIDTDERTGLVPVPWSPGISGTAAAQ